MNNTCVHINKSTQSVDNRVDNNNLNDIAFRITAYRHGTMSDAEYQASVLSILEEWERRRAKQ